MTSSKPGAKVLSLWRRNQIRKAIAAAHRLGPVYTDACGIDWKNEFAPRGKPSGFADPVLPKRTVIFVRGGEYSSKMLRELLARLVG